MNPNEEQKSSFTVVDDQETHCSTDKSQEQGHYKISQDNYRALQDIENELNIVSQSFRDKLKNDEAEEDSSETQETLADISCEEETDAFSFGNPFREEHERFTKVTIRRLPPTLNEEELKDIIGWLPEHNYWNFHKSTDWTSGFSRPCCWINFLDYRDADWFLATFNDYEIIDKKGISYFAVVEYSPNEDVPDETQTVPNELEGTYDPEEDEEFMNLFDDNKVFLSNFEHKTPDEMLFEIEGRTKLRDKVPPLVEFIVQKERERINARTKSREQYDRRREQEEKIKLEKIRIKKDKKKEKRDKERKEKREKEKELKKKLKDENPKKADEKKAPPPEKKSPGNFAADNIKKDVPKEHEKRPEPKPPAESKEIKDTKESSKGDSNNYNKKESGFGGRSRYGSNNSNKPYRDRGDRKNNEQPNQSAKPGPSKIEKKEDANVPKISSAPSRVEPKASGPEKPIEASSTEKPGEPESQPKKKIVKKIIRVKRIKNSEEGYEHLPGGEKENENTKKVIVRVKRVKDEESKGKAGDKETPSTSSSAGGGGGSNSRKASVEEKTTGGGNEKKPQRKGKPDMEYYRPARKNGGGGRPPTKQGPSSSSAKQERES